MESRRTAGAGWVRWHTSAYTITSRAYRIIHSDDVSFFSASPSSSFRLYLPVRPRDRRRDSFYFLAHSFLPLASHSLLSFIFFSAASCGFTSRAIYVVERLLSVSLYVVYYCLRSFFAHASKSLARLNSMHE